MRLTIMYAGTGRMPNSIELHDCGIIYANSPVEKKEWATKNKKYSQWLYFLSRGSLKIGLRREMRLAAFFAVAVVRFERTTSGL